MTRTSIVCDPDVNAPKPPRTASVNGLDVCASAAFLREQFGEDADSYAAEQADAMLFIGDLEGSTVWCKILETIKHHRKLVASGSTIKCEDLLW